MKSLNFEELLDWVKLSVDAKEDKALVDAQMLKAVIETLRSFKGDLERQTAHIKTLEEALFVAANRLEGVSLAVEHQGQNIDPGFFISHYKKWAEEARGEIKAPWKQ